MHILATNDGSGAAPRLASFINLGNVDTLPAYSSGPKGTVAERLAAIKAAGFEGVQGTCVAEAQAAGLKIAGGARFNTPAEIAPVVRAHQAAGYVCLTCHVGWGHEDDQAMDDLVREVIAVSAGEGLPVYIETHRATITQDTWRTVKMVERNPEVRFNGDFSHWYSGLEMPYGNLEDKWRFLQPVFERVRFFHGRMGNSSHIQVPLADPSMAKAVDHFRAMWTRSMAGFKASAGPGDYLIYAPELLHPEINYARLIPDGKGGLVEESDRWQEALRYRDIAQECWVRAQ